jgi:hypothetical protein
MVVVPLSKPAGAEAALETAGEGSCTLVSMVAAVSLATGGVLLATGKRRAGLVAAAAGTALAMVDQKETVTQWWNALPEYLKKLQELLGRVEGAVEDVSEQRERLHKIFKR